MAKLKIPRYRQFLRIREVKQVNRCTLHGSSEEETSYFERFNDTFRQRVSRLVRKTLSFLKSHRSYLVFCTLSQCFIIFVILLRIINITFRLNVLYCTKYLRSQPLMSEAIIVTLMPDCRNSKTFDRYWRKKQLKVHISFTTLRHTVWQ